MSEWEESGGPPDGFVEHDGHLAASIPTYESESDVPSTELAQATDDEHDAVVVVNGELHRCTE